MLSNALLVSVFLCSAFCQLTEAQSAELSSIHAGVGPSATLLDDEVRFVPNAFLGTCQKEELIASWSLPGRHQGDLGVMLWGSLQRVSEATSAGWEYTFTLEYPGVVSVSLDYELVQSGACQVSDRSQVLLAVDGVLRGPVSTRFVSQLLGNASDGEQRVRGWRRFELELGYFESGEHTLMLGAHARGHDSPAEFTSVAFDNVDVAVDTSVALSAGNQVGLRGKLDIQTFKQNIEKLASFGARRRGSDSYIAAELWMVGQLEELGYQVSYHGFEETGGIGAGPRRSIYVTKVGEVAPDRMYIVSAHLDGRGNGGAADDDASGCSLVLEMARMFSRPGFTTDISVRFVFWNSEEAGWIGSTAYADERAPLQGIEDPDQPGHYPEPTWLGVIQHDMLLFDHGLPPEDDQIAEADIDIEYRVGTTMEAESLLLAGFLFQGNADHSADYPAEVGDMMANTDSVAFQDYTASVSVRENMRLAEIGNGSNPHWHRPSDIVENFSEDDFRLGFNALQMTTGTVMELVGARVEASSNSSAR